MAVVPEVVLFGSETWVLTPRLDKFLEGFHHWDEWRMAGMGPKRQQDRTCLYPPIGVDLAMVGLEEIVYISPAARTRSRNILQPIISWTCVWQRIGSR